MGQGLQPNSRRANSREMWVQPVNSWEGGVSSVNETKCSEYGIFLKTQEVTGITRMCAAAGLGPSMGNRGEQPGPGLGWDKDQNWDWDHVRIMWGSGPFFPCCPTGIGSGQVLQRARREPVFHSCLLFVFKHRLHFPAIILRFVLISRS